MHSTMLGRGLTTLALAAGLSLAAAASAEAQEFFIAGNARGCFGAGCVPAENHIFAINGHTLRYNSNTPAPGNVGCAFTATCDFSGSTTGGFFAIEPPNGNLGILGGTGSGRGVNNIPFSLLVQLYNPQGAPDQTFDALLTGFVRTNNNNYQVVFTNQVRGPFAVTDPITGASGNLFLRVNNASVSGTSAPITGFISTTGVVPEPATMTLLGTGLLGLMGAAARRRRKQQNG